MGNNNVRAWIASILAWAKQNNIVVNRRSKVDVEVRLRGGKLFICASHPESWRLSTLGKGSLDDDHTVVTENPDRKVRVRRGPVGRLVDVHYGPGASDAQKLADASRSIAELMDDGPLRDDFLGRFIGEGAL